MRKVGRPPTSIEERFWSKVRKGDGCWEWTGYRKSKDYGYYTILLDGERKSWLTHRLAWRLRHGAIREGLCVLHRCDNPPCVRPDHLFLGTKTENNIDMRRKGRGAIAPPQIGEANCKAKLSEEKVVSIRRLCASGVDKRFIADRYGVGHALIHKIASRQLWKHIPKEQS